jgi:uncharacterized membrane protein
VSGKLEAQRRAVTVWILRASIGLAVLFILVGLELFALRGGAYFPRSPSGSLFEVAAYAWREMLNLRPSAWFDAALLVVLLTPLARLLSGVVASLRARDWGYVLIGLVVMGLVSVGLFAGQAGI